MKIYRLAFMRGEWWIIDGQAHFADGDVGDFNHESYSIQHAQYLLAEDEEWESWKYQKAFEIFENLKDDYEERGEDTWEMGEQARNDPEAFLLDHMEESDVDEDTFFVANGNSSDARMWSMKKMGWKRMAGNQITTWTLTQSDLGDIARGIADIDEEVSDGEKFNIEVVSNGTTYWGVPLIAIESKDLGELRGYGMKSSFGVPTAEIKVKLIKVSKVINVYQGHSVHNKGSKFYTTDKEWARQFTQSGMDNEIAELSIESDKVYRADRLPFASDESDFERGIQEAKKMGYKAMWVDEGSGEPESIYIFDYGFHKGAR